MQTTPQTIKHCNEKPSITQLIRKQPTDFFRSAEVVAFSADPSDDSKDHVTFFRSVESATSHPKALIELSKVVFAVPSVGGLHSLWVTNAHTPPITKLISMAQAVRPGYMVLPSYSHATWRHVARMTGKVSGMLWNGRDAMSLTAETLELDNIHGMQAVFMPNGNAVVHVLSSWNVYEIIVTPKNMENGHVPEPVQVASRINCLLTMPGQGDFQVLDGRSDGLYLNGNHIQDSSGQDIRYLSAASEIRRIFWRNSLGETWGLAFHEGCIASPAVCVDGPRKSQLHFAGTTYAQGKDGAKNQTLMLSRILYDAPDAPDWTHERTLVRLPEALIAPPGVAQTL